MKTMGGDLDNKLRSHAVLCYETIGVAMSYPCGSELYVISPYKSKKHKDLTVFLVSVCQREIFRTSSKE